MGEVSKLTPELRRRQIQAYSKVRDDFALFHPTVAIIPLFGLGCIAAVAYKRTG